MKTTRYIFTSLATLFLACSANAQSVPNNPGLPSTLVQPVVPVLKPETEAALPSLASYAGTYVGVCIYYNITNGIPECQLVLNKDGTIGVTPEFQAKYPYIRVSGRFKRDGTYTYTNNQTNGVIVTVTGVINRQLQKVSGSFTSNSIGTGVLLLNKL